MTYVACTYNVYWEELLVIETCGKLSNVIVNVLNIQF